MKISQIIMNIKNNLELSIYLRSFGIFDTNIISAIEDTPIELFKVESANFNDRLKKKHCGLFIRSYCSKVKISFS